MAELKQMILVRGDLKMSKGKIAAQASHASVEAVLKTHKKLIKAWKEIGMGKIVLKVDSKEELEKLVDKALEEGIVAVTIKDAGHTEVIPGTVTCGAIGPEGKNKIDKITGHLKPL